MTCGPRKDDVNNVGLYVIRYFVIHTDYLVLGQKSLRVYDGLIM
jgi:hypothetical protein